MRSIGGAAAYERAGPDPTLEPDPPPCTRPGSLAGLFKSQTIKSKPYRAASHAHDNGPAHPLARFRAGAQRSRGRARGRGRPLCDPDLPLI
jgi:hypothetical protein